MVIIIISRSRIDACFFFIILTSTSIYGRLIRADSVMALFARVTSRKGSFVDPLRRYIQPNGNTTGTNRGQVPKRRGLTMGLVTTRLLGVTV